MRLEDLQAQLVRALMDQGEPPDGFDAARLAMAACSLINKRLRESARAWPALARCLGERYAERFRESARVTPPPAEGGPLADGRAFLQTIPITELDEEARREGLLVDLHWRTTRGGLKRRRGCVVKWARLGGRLVVGVRLPGGGVRLFRL
jgi:hypothetical protein